MGYEFTLVLDHDPTDDDLDALFNAGCHDATFEDFDKVPVGHFIRVSSSLTQAISSAVHDIEKAGFHAVEVRREDIGDPSMWLQYAREIAAANMMVQTRAYLAEQRRGR